MNIIAIDGPSGTGKSTVAKTLAARLGFDYFDTGAMYRSLAVFLLDSNIPLDQPEKVAANLCFFHYEVRGSYSNKSYYVNCRNVTDAIRSHEISAAASKIATYPEVRKKLVEIQRDFGNRKNSVFEGRDMGTVVFPNTKYKFFITASSQVRARRRFLELKKKNPEQHPSEEQVLKDIEERDLSDSTRAHSPLKQAKDAILIDTSDLSIEEVAERILSFIAPPKPSILYRVVRFISSNWVKMLYKPTIIGNFKSLNGPFLIATNHTSNLDPFLVASFFEEPLHFLAKKSLFANPALNKILLKLNAHPIDRENTSTKDIKTILSLLKRGLKVVIFPEGTRGSEEELLPFQKGICFLSIQACCPILPIYLDGCHKIWPKGKRLPQINGKISCIIGDPIFPPLNQEGSEDIELYQNLLNQTFHDLKNRLK
jgi:cytidylate kinase